MDCVRDLEFHDDSSRALEKAKESILLIKKKMFLSNDLIVQYNNKLKECERLKGDLYLAQEEVAKLKRDNNANLSKVVRLEMQSTDNKKARMELEQKIAEKDIQIGGNKSHLQQLECKLEAAESQHTDKVMELELDKSSLEGKVKELEQELKSLKRSHQIEINKLERVPKTPKEKKGKKCNEAAKETKEIGVNTVEDAKLAQPIKPRTAEKSVLTNEFYHIRDDPYPIFCHKCEVSVEPKVEKICEIMAHPPLVGNMLSPVRSRESRLNHNNSNDLDMSRFNVPRHDLHSSFRTEKTNHKNTKPVESNPAEFHDDPISRNFVPPPTSQLTINSSVPEIQVIPVDATVPELADLRRKVATLERRIKKQKTRKSSDSRLPSTNHHSHPSLNCCGHSSTHVNPTPNVFPNAQADLMTEFFNRMMNLTGQRDRQESPSKIVSRRRERRLRDRGAKVKLRKLKRTKILKKTSNWNVESDHECKVDETPETFDPSDPTMPHLLRIKPSRDNSRVESEKSSAEEDPWDASFAETRPESPEHADQSPEKSNRIERDSNQESVVKVPDKSTNSTRRVIRKSSLFNDEDDDSETEVEFVKNAIAEKSRLVNRRKNSAGRARTRSESSEDKENESKNQLAEKSIYEPQNSENISRESTINESVSDLPASSFTHSDADHPEMNSDLESSDLQRQVDQRKRKRSSSPKATKRTGRSNLLGKLRDLKKKTSSVTCVATQSTASVVHATRSLSRRKLTEQSESEGFEENSLTNISQDDENPCVPIKKQRIAHVPKAAAQETPEASKMSNSTSTEPSEDICRAAKEKAAEELTIVVTKKPRTRRSTSSVEKLAPSESKNDPESGKVDGVELPADVATTVLPRRRGRPPGKRNAATIARLNAQLREAASTAKPLGNNVSKEEAAVGSVLANQLDEKSNSKNTKISNDNIGDNDNNSREASASLEKEDVPEANSILELNGAKETSTVSIGIGDKDKNGEASVLLEKKRVSAEESILELIRAKKTSTVSIGIDDKDKNGEASVLLEKKRVSAEESILELIRAKKTSTVSIGIDDKDNDGEASVLLEKERFSVADSIVELNRAKETSIPSIAVTAGASDLSAGAADKSDEVVRAPPAEKMTPSLLLDASSASPAASPDESSVSPVASLAPLDALSTKPAISPKRSTVSTIATTIEENKLSENSACPDASKISSNDEAECKTISRIPENSSASSDSTKVCSSADTERKTISTIADDSPASPDASYSLSESTPLSPGKNVEKYLASKSPKRLSIYSNVELPVVEETASITPLNYYSTVKDATTAKKEFVRDTSSEMPIEKPIERNLLIYDANLHDDAVNHDEDFDSSNIVKPQFFVETSTVENREARERSSSVVEPTKVVKALRSRQVLCDPPTFASPQNAQKIPKPSKDDAENVPTSNRAENAIASSDANVSKPIGYPVLRNLETLLSLHLSTQKKKNVTAYTNLQRAGAMKLQQIAEKDVKVELEKLVETDEWTTEMHQSVITKILEIRSERTVAKCIVDFMIEKSSLDEPLDRTHTPPAPIMTRTQQRLVTLMKSLQREETMQRLFDLVQAGIDFAVFNCGGGQSLKMVEYLVRVTTVISRIRKDRERVRIMCCDAFYTLGRKAVATIHVILTVWPEVLPKHGTSESELPNCLAHMIKQETLQSGCPIPKLSAMKKMVTSYYEYPQTQATSTVVMTVLMRALHENYSSDLETAILLVSKREGTEWALDNVIEKGLMRIIQDDSYQWQFEVLRLLGFILRTFPFSSPDKSVHKYVELLRKMLDSGKGSQDKQEGLVSALLSLSRYASLFGKIADSILQWKPSGDLRASTLEQLDSFFKSHTPQWWNTRHTLKMKKNRQAGGKSN